jgi:hypothetical protein
MRLTFELAQVLHRRETTRPEEHSALRALRIGRQGILRLLKTKQ